MTSQGLEACLAFGAASLAVMEARGWLAEGEAEEGPEMAELVSAHERLRALFGAGTVEGVPELALSVMVLAERLTTGGV